MDVINEQALYHDAISPALDKVRGDLVPALQQALQATLNTTVEQISNVFHGVLLGIQATEDKTVLDLAALIGAPSLRQLLDAFTITVQPQGPIASITGPIVITLGAPPKKEQ